MPARTAEHLKHSRGPQSARKECYVKGACARYYSCENLEAYGNGYVTERENQDKMSVVSSVGSE